MFLDNNVKRGLVLAMGLKHDQLTLMFTDIVGYSRLMSKNEAQTIELLGEYRRILLVQIESHNGTLIEYIGDAAFARFKTPQAAVQAGIDIQKSIQTFNQSSSDNIPTLQSRIGIHMGEVALKDDAFFGDGVNIAARLEPLSVAGGLCISDVVYQAVRGNLSEPVMSIGVQHLKNIDDPIHSYLIRPAGITLATRTHYFLSKFQYKFKTYRYPIAASVFLIIALGFYFIPQWLVPGYNANYVEIADFKSFMSEDGEPNYFSAGITEVLRSQLADMRDVYILDAAKGVRGPIRLEGSVQKVADSLRIAYRLFRRKDNVQIAGGKLDGTYKDIFILQDRIVSEIAGYLANEFNLKNFRPAALKITSDVTAYDYYLKGLQYLRMPKSHDNFDKAIQDFSTALIHDPGFALANAGLCSAYREKFVLTLTTNLADRAEEYCQTALSQDNTLFQVYEALGLLYRDTGRGDEAVELLQKAIKMDSTEAHGLLALGRVYVNQNKLELARDTFKKAIEVSPKYWEVYHVYATFLFKHGNQDEAIELYKKALRITPDNSVTLNNLGGTYIHTGDFKKAANALERSVELSPTSWGYSNTGTIYYFAGEFSKATEMFREAVRLSPEDFKLYVNLADALRQIPSLQNDAKEHYRTSIKLVKSAIEVNEQSAEYYRYLALSYLYTDDLKNATFFLEKAVSLSPKNINILYAKVRYQVYTENFENALRDLEVLLASGYSKSLVEADPDLRALTDLPEYIQIVAVK